MSKRKQSILSLLFVLSCTGIAAQIQDPVIWNAQLIPVEDNLFEVQVSTEMERGWHIYDMGPYPAGPLPTSLRLSLDGKARAVDSARIITPVEKVMDDIFGMEIGICYDRCVIAQKIRVIAAGPAAIQAVVEWQACNNASCLPPGEQAFSLELPASDPAAAIDAESGAKDTRVRAPVDPLASSMPKRSKSLWGIILEAVIWGFVALLTPCVFPMVPMTVSFFLKQSYAHSKAKGRTLALVFGLSIIALYTLPIAAIILITYFAGGDAITANIFNWLATHWLPNLLFFAIFMIFAASFFGAFEITLPSGMVNKSDAKADKGGWIGVFFMALTLVLVSFSCTGPIVGSVLIKSTQGAIWEPIVTMLAFSVAFALPFTLFAFVPSLLKNLPKSGGWLNSVKVVLGFIEVALGFKFLSVADQTYHWGLLDREVYLAIWIVVFTLLGFYLLGKIRFANDSDRPHTGVFRLFLSIAVFAFVIYMIPGMWGAPLKALSGYLPPITSQDFVLGNTSETVSRKITGSEAGEANDGDLRPLYSDKLHLPHNLKGFFNYEEALAYARKTGKPLFVDFTGHGCVNCREMEMRVWSDPRVLKLFRENYVIAALYSDDKMQVDKAHYVTTEKGKVLKTLGKINAYFAEKRFSVNAQPFYAILDPYTEAYKTSPRGYSLDIEAFIAFLQEGLK